MFCEEEEEELLQVQTLQQFFFNYVLCGLHARRLQSCKQSQDLLFN
jgi:hypothetical protein